MKKSNLNFSKKFYQGMEKTAEIPFLTVFYFFNKIEKQLSTHPFEHLAKKAEKSGKNSKQISQNFSPGDGKLFEIFLFNGLLFF